MTSLQMLNSKAESARQYQALAMNINATKGLQELMKTNLGPKGTLKMLVSGSGDIKITKDGNVLLHEMQIQNPTAALVARAATAQDDIVGDGTTSTVLIIGEIMMQADRYLADKVHPRILTDGIDEARVTILESLERLAIQGERAKALDRELLLSVARSSLRSKLRTEMADQLTDIVTDAILTIHRPNKPIDLFMVEIMTMQHKSDTDTRFVNGLVMDHGCRHPDMPKKLSNAFVLTCNIGLEYEKTEVNTGFYYKSAEQRQKMIESERKTVDDRCRAIIELKRAVCTNGQSFLIVNQNGIDPMSLDMFAKEGIMALRRAKRRNMERLTLACGGEQVNTVDGLSPTVLGWCGKVYETVLGEEKFTFVEEVKNPQSCTILLKGPHKHVIEQLKDAVRDGLRAVKNTIEDGRVLPGGGALEIALHKILTEKAQSMNSRARLGVQVIADALLVIPKILAENSGFDAMDCVLALQSEQNSCGSTNIGLDLSTGLPVDVDAEGIYDNFRVKRNQIHSSTVLASQLLLVDEILRAGKAS